MNALAPIGRVLFALIFILSSFSLFTHEAIAYAGAAGTPIPSLLVPLAGILALVGGLMVALGYRARIGAILLICFLVPVTLIMHRFWGLSDTQEAQTQVANFLKNTSLIGASLYFVYAGAGAYSLDARAHRTGLLGQPRHTLA